MAKMNSRSKASSGSRSSYRKSRSHSPGSNSMYQSQNYVSLFGTSNCMQSCSSIGLGHPMSCRSQPPDFAESVKMAQSLDGKLPKPNLDQAGEKQGQPVFTATPNQQRDGSFGESMVISISEIKLNETESSGSQGRGQQQPTVMSRRESRRKASKMNASSRGITKAGKYGEMTLSQRGIGEKKHAITKGKRDKLRPDNEACCVIY